MRAWSRSQRFPVAHWVEDLEILQLTAIAKHRKHSRPENHHPRTSFLRMSISSVSRASTQTLVQPTDSSRFFRHFRGSGIEMHRPGLHGRTQSQAMSLFSVERSNSFAEEGSSHATDGQAISDNQRLSRMPLSFSPGTYPCRELAETPPIITRSENYSTRNSTSLSLENSLQNAAGLNDQIRVVPEDAMSHLSLRGQNHNASSLSLLSVDNVIREDRTLNLQKVNPFFTDASGTYSQKFEKRLQQLNRRNSEDQLCIETYLSKSEKEWFSIYRDMKLGRSPSRANSASPILGHLTPSSEGVGGTTPVVPGSPVVDSKMSEQGLKLPEGYVPPSGLKKFMLYRIGDWPVYSIFLAFVSFKDPATHQPCR